ncbi:MAG: transketolase [Proteobacteria bacterium]|nr:transketolase [Pseudomonadota bacterium]
MTAHSSLSELCINTIRTLSIDAVQKANSGHPGLPLGAAPMAFVLWQNHLRHDPGDPRWPDRDRFVLSAGHGSMLLYSLLHLTGYDMSLDDLKAFRQWNSKTPGHPERHMTPGVEATTGPLGQGVSNAVGMAMAERFLAHRFNRPGHDIVNHHTYALVSDGDLMEGVAAEAVSLAGHMGLGKLIALYDSNDVTLDGPASLSFTGEDVAARFAAYGWHVQHVEDGNRDLEAIDGAISAARDETGRPSLIVVRTTIGYGSPNKAGRSASHGSPLGPDEVALTKQALAWDPEKEFYVPGEVARHMGAAVTRGASLRSQWQAQLDEYARAHPNLAEQWQRCMAGELPEGWNSALPVWQTGQSVATRSAAGKVLTAIAERVPWLLGGDADLGGSTKTLIPGGDFDGKSGAGRNIHFGVREHAMGAICNGMSYHGGIRPYAATFFVFSDYMRPSVRLAALNDLPVIYVWTHDSIGLGEDGPTHQPVEHLMSLRAMPNLHVIRPADSNEAAQAWVYALERTTGPTALVLSRQNLPVVEGTGSGGLARGAYVVADAPEQQTARAILIATGSEVALALAARDLLAERGVFVRVVSMPCWEAFRAQSADYRESVLPPSIAARVSVEAGVTLGWEAWIGPTGTAIGVDRYGASAPAAVLMEQYGLTAERVAAAALDLL